MSSQENGQVSGLIKFTVYGELCAQGRPRATTRGGHVRMYDPEESRNYKQMVRIEALQVKPEKPLDGEISLIIRAYKSIPKSMSKKRHKLALEGRIKPITKPDIDNIVKGVKDALKGVIWRDDSQVVTLLAKKYYSDVPRVEVIVEEIKCE